MSNSHAAALTARWYSNVCSGST